jgi:hypothetical protein
MQTKGGSSLNLKFTAPLSDVRRIKNVEIHKNSRKSSHVTSLNFELGLALLQGRCDIYVV